MTHVFPIPRDGVGFPSLTVSSRQSLAELRGVLSVTVCRLQLVRPQHFAADVGLSQPVGG